MKKQFILSFAVLVLSTSAIFAQAGGGPRMSVEERVKAAMEKLADLKLDTAKSSAASAVFSNFYSAQQKQREEARAAGGEPDRDAMRAKNQKLAADRDEKLKAIFTDDQYKKWKDEIEPSLRPQRPNRQR